MTADRRAVAPAAIGRILIVSAIVMFALSLAFWNDLLPFLGLSVDARPLVAGALLVNYAKTYFTGAAWAVFGP